MKINFKRFRNILGGIGGSLFVASSIATFFTISIPFNITIFGFVASLVFVTLSIIEFKGEKS